MRGHILLLLATLLLSACAGGGARNIYVDKDYGKPRPAPAQQNAAYESWRKQKPVKEFYQAQAPLRAAAPRAPSPSAGPQCKLLSKGMASWYGYELYGNNTANGEKFEPDGITAAHKTLPFGTIVKVTLDNGRGNPEGVYVRINDRGPFVHGRIIDLSLGAAKKLGMKDTQPVHIYTCS